MKDIHQRQKMTRRDALRFCVLGAAASCFGFRSISGETTFRSLKLNYALASSLFGVEPLHEILAVMSRCGAEWIDLWPLRHGNQREQVEEMGREKFRDLLKQYDVKLGLTTRYDLGPFALADEMKFVAEFGGRMIVTGPVGPKGQKGDELKKAVDVFYEKLRPHLEEAEKNRVVIAIENHSAMLLDSPDAIRYFVDRIDSPWLGIAFAPYHLPQDESVQSDLIRHCGSRLSLFYAWQHGKGCMTQLPKDQQLEQLPGRGPLDFDPLLQALAEIDFKGFTEIFMHPFPRGVPIDDSVERSAEQIKHCRMYLETGIKQAALL